GWSDARLNDASVPARGRASLAASPVQLHRRGETRLPPPYTKVGGTGASRPLPWRDRFSAPPRPSAWGRRCPAARRFHFLPFAGRPGIAGVAVQQIQVLAQA